MKNRFIAALGAAFLLLAGFSASAAQAVVDPCAVTVNLQGINVKPNQVRIGVVQANAKLNVTTIGCGELSYTYSVSVPKLGVNLTGLTDVTATNKTVLVYSALLNNSDAGHSVAGKVTFSGGDGATPDSPVFFGVTPLRYTSWTRTYAQPEPIDAGLKTVAYAWLRVANWDTDTTDRFPGRATRLQRRVVPDTTFTSGLLVRGTPSGRSETIVTLGHPWDTTNKTYVLRFAYNGNTDAGFAPNWSYGDAVLVRAED